MERKTENIKVNVYGYGNLVVDKGITLEKLLMELKKDKYSNYLAAIIDNEIRHLEYKIEKNCNIKFIDITHKDGMRIYTRTLAFIFIKACKDLFGDCRVNIEHSLSNGIYTEIYKENKVNHIDIIKIKNRMKQIIEENIPINRVLMPKTKAQEIFRNQGMEDKVKLLNYVEKDNVHVYDIDGFYGLFYGYLAPSTGYVNEFNLKYYFPGVILQYPRKENNYKVPKFIEQSKLAKIFRESEEWGDILDLGYVGSLNEKIVNGSIGEVIRISEALHEKKIAYFADMITKDKDIRLILISGPSSSGKTTFAQRLGIQLKVNGKKPIAISLDDYFVNREDTPKDENGNYDFESINAIDIELFNNDLVKLLSGKEVEIPRYNFVTGKREYTGRKIMIDEDHPIIVEGIHGLNEILTSSIPHNNKFKIYISALTQLNLDSHNRIHTTDTRLIRRIVRDNKYRGNNALRTLELWDSVRRGEEKNIFPYQEEADVMFNSSLVYELAILKKYAEPLLKEIDSSSPYYSESKRLLKFLQYFKSIEDEDDIPCTSIIREFIGGSCFRWE